VPQRYHTNGRAWRRGSDATFIALSEPKGKAGGGLCCPGLQSLKASDQSHWLVSTLRPPRLSRGTAVESQNQ